jgi:hypothetical protein
MIIKSKAGRAAPIRCVVCHKLSFWTLPAHLYMTTDWHFKSFRLNSSSRFYSTISEHFSRKALTGPDNDRMALYGGSMSAKVHIWEKIIACPMNSWVSDRVIVSQLPRLGHPISLKESNFHGQWKKLK